LTTLYRWPEIEPTQFAWYDDKLLNVPLRKDILHRAVIFEADGSRRGTASAKWRGEVHGSNRKIQPQKGMGRARAGDKKSPIRRGGGKAFGPHPRDFSTKLQRKVYGLAWRTALSHRYRKGELIVLQNSIRLPEDAGGAFLQNFFKKNKWGKGNGRSMLVTGTMLDKCSKLKTAMAEVSHHGLIKDRWDVDVKDLLETGRIVIEKQALDVLLRAHSSDLFGLTSSTPAERERFLRDGHTSRTAMSEEEDDEDDEEEDYDGDELDDREFDTEDKDSEDELNRKAEFDMEKFEAETFADRGQVRAR
jgi:large subunit ribosomal protein L4